MCIYKGNIAFSRQTVAGSMMLVSGRYFEVMGAQPLLGRLIGPEDDGAGNPVAVVDYRYWQEKLGGEPDVLNQTWRSMAKRSPWSALLRVHGRDAANRYWRRLIALGHCGGCCLLAGPAGVEGQSAGGPAV